MTKVTYLFINSLIIIIIIIIIINIIIINYLSRCSSSIKHVDVFALDDKGNSANIIVVIILYVIIIIIINYHF